MHIMLLIVVRIGIQGIYLAYPELA